MALQRELLQQAWVVDDLEAAARRWSAMLGIGPFYIAEYRPDFFVDVQYRGQPGTLAMRTAICYSGAVQIELIEPTGTAPSCYRDTVPAGREGFHHICYWTHDLEADVASYVARGCVLANRARVPNGRGFAYLDATASIGCMIELLEYSERLEAVFAGWRDTCAAWQGGELFIRR
jgi:catechol 2,3-dioxygenase-like lactoylglutathione lyase family enzyme